MADLKKPKMAPLDVLLEMVYNQRGMDPQTVEGYKLNPERIPKEAPKDINLPAASVRLKKKKA